MHGKKVHPLPDTPFTKAVLKHMEVVAHKIATKYHRSKDDEEDKPAEEEPVKPAEPEAKSEDK